MILITLEESRNAPIKFINLKAETMKKITTEYEGKFEETPLEDLIDFLCNMAEIALDSEDFVRKVTHGVTDETSRLSQIDKQTLRDWYFEEYPKISAA